LKILVTGGCGYVGSALVPNLIKDGHEVTVIDAQWFGVNLEPHKLLSVEKLHLSEIKESNLIGVDCVIHLANIANDPSVDLNPVLSWEVNTLHTTQLLELCKKVKIKKFIYASSGSVYGVKDENNVTEELSLVPLSAYNKTKMVAERVCLSYKEHFNVYCIRPATVCGLSPRMRFDVVVNMFVLQAFTNNQITVLGGEQVRPNIHIEDMVRVYQHFITESNIQSGCYNAGFENLRVSEIAEKVAKIFGCEIVVKDSNDPRSYRQDSEKLLSTGFVPLSNVSNAIEEIRNALKDRKILDRPDAHTVEWMKENNFDRITYSGT
jgi:nucleoside-diphosphate-sugar epimerase